MADINVNYTTLSDLAQQLASLRDEFKNSSGLEHYVTDAMVGITHENLRDKLGRFNNGWSDRRSSIIGVLDQTAGFARQAADAYRSLDEESAVPSTPASPPAGP